MNSVYLSRPPQSARFIPSPRSQKATKARRKSIDTMMTSPTNYDDTGMSSPIAHFNDEEKMSPPQSARSIPSPRSAKATRARRKSFAAMMTSSTDYDQITTSSPIVHWNKKEGVMNLGFNDDEMDCTSPDISRDSGFDDVSPVMSPINNEIYQSHENRRKSFGGFATYNYFNSVAPPNERRPLVQLEPGEAIKSNYGSGNVMEKNSSVLFESERLSSKVKKNKKTRSSSLLEPELPRQFISKPRSNSQPLLKTLTSRLFSTLDSVSEEELYQKATPKRDKYNSKTPLIGANDKLTIHPGYQSQSGISLNDWQVKLGEQEPAQCRCDNEAPQQPPPPPPKKETKETRPPPPPPPSDSVSSVHYVAGLQASIGDSVPMFASDTPSEIDGIVASFGTNRSMAEIMESPLRSGGSSTYSNTASGETFLNLPPPSAGRRRKSLKTIFRLGFLTTKNKKKYSKEDTVLSPDAGPQPPSPGKRVVQRRMSRLEMNEPIEDIFSEVKFETIQKRPSTSNSAGNDIMSSGNISDDDDIIEDPEVIMRSIMNQKAHENEDNDNLVFNDVIDPVTHDNSGVISPSNLEKQFLLPEADRNRKALEPVCEESPTKSSDEDLT